MLFQWGQQKEERRIHWAAWSKMCKSKFLGGLGFKDLHGFNMALLAKQIPTSKPYRAIFNEDLQGLAPRVSDFIDSPSNTWNASNIKAFVPEQARVILSISLSFSGQYDDVIWHFHKSGSYKVSSGYAVWTNILSGLNYRGSAQSRGSTTEFDPNLWKA
ncbi:conserved hypothetical protein [Ricinus communis]|uniref:Uncharacterized protein n=1 Tax=Ricinus communis TaxID=3988 RepID=B9RAH7_RICCO|nr:conserved hypothetical protein [Ricinus communis]